MTKPALQSATELHTLLTAILSIAPFKDEL
jgi:hypothetical protein